MNSRYSNNAYRKKPEDPIRASLLINEQIRYQDVRLLDVDGNPVGVMNSKQAIRMAYDHGLDLVEVTASANPPVVRIVDLNKWIFNLKRSKKEQDKKIRQNAIVIKEIQLRPVIDKHDLEIKINRAKEFLADNIKLKVVIKFRGRELNFSNKGFEVMQAFITGLGPCRIEKQPELEGKSISAVISPAVKNLNTP